jgi:hypothetical protein
MLAGDAGFKAGIDPADVFFNGHRSGLKEPQFKYRKKQRPPNG